MNQKIIQKIVVAYPSGNTTAVIFDDLGQQDREKLNASILETWQAKFPDKSPIEQCCFLSQSADPKVLGRVEMFGDEFCGNATRSAVWLLADGKDSSGLIEASGCDELLEYTIVDGIVSLKMPEFITTETEKGLAVTFKGITQLVISTGSTHDVLKQILESGYLSLNDRPALGVSSYNERTKQALFSVWVNNVNTIFDETACGSGTAAIGIAQATNAKRSQNLQIIQPSNEPINVKVETDNDGKARSAEISGPISTLYSGMMELL